MADEHLHYFSSDTTEETINRQNAWNERIAGYGLVGSVVMGVRVVDRDEQRVKPVIALLRALACVIFPIGLAWVVVDPERRSAQDILLSTRVVYDRAG